jgi:hypothetical protein
MNNNEDGVLAVVGARRAPILVRLNEFNGRRTVDVRRYFSAEGKSNLLPTQKGVSLDRDGLALILAALNDNSELIAEWLGSDAGRALAANARGAERARSAPRPHTADTEQWKSPAFFHVFAEGATDHLTLNSTHAFNKAMNALSATVDAPTAELVRALVAGVLISYYRSKMLFDGVAEMPPMDIFETLELNWGIVLKRYAEQICNEVGEV